MLGDRDQPTVADYGHLKYMMRCVNESMRLYPHPPVLLRRAMIADELPGGPCRRPHGHDYATMQGRRAERLRQPWQINCMRACRLGCCSSLGCTTAIAACAGLTASKQGVSRVMPSPLRGVLTVALTLCVGSLSAAQPLPFLHLLAGLLEASSAQPKLLQQQASEAVLPVA